MPSSDEESRERIRELREYSPESDRPSEITIANVGTVKVRIPRRQHRAIGWSVVALMAACTCYVLLKAWSIIR